MYDNARTHAQEGIVYKVSIDRTDAADTLFIEVIEVDGKPGPPFAKRMRIAAWETPTNPVIGYA